MTSNPISTCCISGFKHEGTPSGRLEPWIETQNGPVEAYISKPPANKDLKHGLLFIPDVIGPTSLNAQLLADTFASQGYTVVIPDLFHGDAIAMNNFANTDLPKWLQGHYHPSHLPHTPETVDPIVAGSIAKMRGADTGLTKLGGLGYCFGAKYAVRFLRGDKSDTRPQGESTTAHLDAAFIAHPSFVEESELSLVAAPLSIAAAETDAIFTAAHRRRSEEILAQRGIEEGVAWQINLYGGVSHGFAVRGDREDRRQRWAMEGAARQAGEWFEVWLR
ncbi:uncharacterized protein HMPREF1541_02890 [Cyphellophora europaea CBS 101466]|uniref:Dienelactone hydrolase domain-containing protein n=1 Tax=Cyphellophora europaea (strain CBS 101466) TaxID=1220924 RepID=W2S4V9_CYPE1|nr:uncharacterized protein HMPREF1541_02890 [Cyphellophora europaea CBS 101466]ETN43731.1 hypothetical protein HMPREF1541_02890 [Cyphellophora europaea CBS 101466]